MDLPRELNFGMAADLPKIGLGTSTIENVIATIGGATSFSLLTAGNNINFDLPSRGFIDGSTLYLKYKMRVTNTSLVVDAVNAANTTYRNSQIRCTPFYTPISRVDTFVGSSIAESLIGYNIYQNFKTQTTMNNSMKYSQVTTLGLRNEKELVTSNSLDGRFIDGVTGVPSVEFSMAGALDCCLTNCKDVFVPVCFMASTRISLTFDTINNIFAAGAVVNAVDATSTAATAAIALPADCVISDVFLCYTSVHFPPDVEAAIYNQYSKDGIVLRTQSYMMGSNMLPAGSVGQVDLQYNHRLSSIRSCFLLSSTSTSVNSIFDSFDITQNNGEYSIVISGRTYPNRPHNTTTSHKSAIMVELRKAVSSLFSKDTNMSINNTEFNRVLTAAPAIGNAGASSVLDPAKFYVPFRTHVLSDKSTFLSGVSCNDGPIAVRIVLNTPTGAISTVNLVSVYDLLLTIDVKTKTISSYI